MARKENKNTLLIEFKDYQKAFIRAESKRGDSSMTKVVRELVDKEIERRALKAKKSTAKTS